MIRPLAAALACALAAPAVLPAQDADSALAAYTPEECPPCAEWNAPHAPFRLHGGTWYVGTAGLSAILLTSPEGHILVDGGLPESAPRIAESIRAAGFRVEDVRLILNSHAHYDHAGGIAALARLSGAEVAALPWSAAVMRSGRTRPEDPQFEVALAYPAVSAVREIADGDTLRVGPLAVVAHATGGHTPGGTSWSWRSCEGDGDARRCLDLVYADSQTPVSADAYRFSRSARYPGVLDDFAHGFATLERLSCDVLLTPHPGASRLFERVARRDGGEAGALRDPEACRAYAAAARRQLEARLARERATP